MKIGHKGKWHTVIELNDDETIVANKPSTHMLKTAYELIDLEAFDSPNKSVIMYAALCEAMAKIGFACGDPNRDESFAEAIKKTILESIKAKRD